MAETLTGTGAGFGGDLTVTLTGTDGLQRFPICARFFTARNISDVSLTV